MQESNDWGPKQSPEAGPKVRSTGIRGRERKGAFANDFMISLSGWRYH